MIIDQFLSAIFEKVARTISLNNYRTDLRNQSKMKFFNVRDGRVFPLRKFAKF